MLVVSIPKLAFGLVEGEIELLDAVVTARIDRSGGRLTLKDGLLVGRAHANDILGALRYIDVAGQTVCKEPELFNAVRAVICLARDLPLTSPLAPTDPNEECSTISLALGFAAEPARIGTRSAFMQDSGCPGDLSVSCTD
ncbi:MAG: hypothetical protein K0S65_6562 [Labilithrix sp.]|nr:hypothetical protein [Labilithrix sp.]